MARYLDMKYLTVPLLINMFTLPKFQIGGEVGGISCEVMSWRNLFAFGTVLSAFSFVSIEVPLTLTLFTTRPFNFRLRYGNRPLLAAVLFMASLISPRPVFWHVYPVVLLLFFLPTARLFQHSLRAIQSLIPISINRVYDIFISISVSGMNEPHHQQQDEEPNSETPDLEANNIEAE